MQNLEKPMLEDKKISRRGILKTWGTAAALMGAGSFIHSGSLQAAAKKQTKQVPGFYRFTLGDFEITILSDGSYSLPTDLIARNQPREIVKAYLKSNYLNTEQRTSHVNIPLINTGKELILVDVGGGPNFLSGAGQLVTNMQASGYKPEDVDKIIFTHGHPDHLWGLIDDFDETVYPNAEYFMSVKEWDFWATNKAKTKLPESFQSMAAGASRRLPVIEEKTKQIKSGTEISPGIMTIDTAGHTPGHTSLLIKSGSESLIVSSDTLTHPFISFEHPDWWPRTDLDTEQAEKSRRKILEMAITDRSLVLSYHISFPGLGNVARQGKSYRWVPATWQWQI